VLQSGDGTGVVGVHIRYSDNLYDANKVQHGLVTEIQAFDQAIALAVEIVRVRRRLSDVRVLLCTDNHHVRRYLGEKGLRCVAPPCISTDRYLQALFEMLLLASTDIVVGSSSSTFSYESVFMNQGTDLMLCHGGIWQTFHISKR
jgi:hypothetical protein